MNTARAAWLTMMAGLSTVCLPSCELIPLPWMVKPVTALLAGLAALLAIAARPTLLAEQARERTNHLLAAFVGIALFATVLGLGAGLEPLKGSSPLAAAVKAWASLILGLGTWFGLRCLIRGPREAVLAERWLWGGLAAAVAMALVQAAADLQMPGCQPVVTWAAHNLGGSTMLDGRTPGRAWGLSPEPSLLGSQLAVAGLVPALARLCAPQPGDGPRWIPWSAAALCCLGLGLSRARTGLGLAIVLIPLAVALAWWWRAGARRGLGVTAACLGLLLAGMLGLAACNPYLRATTSGAVGGATATERAASSGMSSRLAAWCAGWEAAREHPLTGVGLGLAPWQVVRHLPAWSLRDNAETQSWIDPGPGSLPNIKHLWLRIAAETGVAGLLAFCAFIACIAWPRRRDDPAVRLCGVLAGLAVLGDGFSLDSFALPTIWVVLALAAARRQPEQTACAAS
jgi:O-antigen ligase